MSKLKCIGFTLAMVLLGAIGGCSGSEDPPAAAPETQLQSPPAKVIDSRPNAATEYARIHAALGDGFMTPLADLGSKSPPNTEQSALLASKQEVIRDIMAASRIERCDFNTDFSQGMDALMTHVSWLRNLGKLLQYDAHRFVQQPSGQDGAAERLAALVRMSKHIGAESVAISKLVGFAMCNLATDSIRDWQTRLTLPQVKSTLRSELESLRTSALFDLRPAIRQELAMAKTSIAQGGSQVRGLVSEQEKTQVIAELERVFGEIERALDSPDAVAKIKKIVGSAKGSAAQFVANFDNLVQQMQSARGRLDSTVAALR